MTREEIDTRLEENRIAIRTNQSERTLLADKAVFAEANYKKRLMGAYLKTEVSSLKAADERKLMAEQLVIEDWLNWKIAQNAATAQREIVENLRSETSSLQTSAKLLISEQEFERALHYEP